MPNNGRHLDLDSFLPYRLSVLTNRVSNALARHYSERFGLSVAEWRVIAVLGQSPGLSARDVALRTEMDKVQVSRAVADLVRRRRVQKTMDGVDGRVTRLALTARGGLIYNEIVPQALELEERFLSALDMRERVAFDRLIAKLFVESNRLDAFPPLVAGEVGPKAGEGGSRARLLPPTGPSLRSRRLPRRRARKESSVLAAE
ncbi:MAG TPA: MarR family winged helix-turn-helix transcriptional regulator [Rhizomicrobium sp.]|jgi:DNA-binding MarR family transcriptional regulator|nr:MarR family winged helix-turn-helix transcriptional regulator [Rhizomicrobium sp.]